MNMTLRAKAHDTTQNLFLWVLTGPSSVLTRVQLGLNLLRPPRDNAEAI